MAPKHATIDDYIAGSAEAVRPLLTELRAFIHAAMPGATEAMRYGAPYFLNAHSVPVIYLFSSKDHVNFGFLRSNDLSDPDGVLRGSGKPSKHIRVYPDTSYDMDLLREFLGQCAGMRP